MTHEYALHPELLTTRPHLDFGSEPESEPEPEPGHEPRSLARAVVLIQVPEVRRQARAPRRPSAAATMRPRTQGRNAPRRRRLRREVRLVGSALAVVLPMLLGLVLLRHGPASARPVDAAGEARSAAVATARPPAVSLSIEAPDSTHPTPQAPVVFPGYLLPDDGGEEPAHAGG